MSEELKPSKKEVLENAKNRPSTTRASRRARTMALVKQVTSLLEQLGPHKHEAVQVLVDQLSATKGVYYNGLKIDEVPDEIIRQKAAIAILEWLEGKPRELQIQMTGSPDDFQAMVAKYAHLEKEYSQKQESLQKDRARPRDTTGIARRYERRRGTGELKMRGLVTKRPKC